MTGKRGKRSWAARLSARFGKKIMSRIGKQFIIIPEGVTVKAINDGLQASGQKGNLQIKINPGIAVEIKEGKIFFTRSSEEKAVKSIHGLSRALVANAIEGVVNGFSRSLKIIGTGYRIKLEGDKLILSVGFSHPVEFLSPAGIKLSVEGNDVIKISGIDKELVGQTAAKIRAIKPPEPYKGKGIRYLGEKVRTKAGKAGKAGVAGAVKA